METRKAEGTADYNVSLVKFRQIVDGEELYNIDRLHLLAQEVIQQIYAEHLPKTIG